MIITFGMSRHPEKGLRVDDFNITGSLIIGDSTEDGWIPYNPFQFEPGYELSTKIMSLTLLAEDDRLISMASFDANWQLMVIGICLESYVLGMASSPNLEFTPPEELHRQMVAIWMRAGETGTLLEGGPDPRWRQLVEGMCLDSFQAGLKSNTRLMIRREPK